MKCNILWNSDLFFATKFDLDNAVGKMASHQQFDESLFLNVDKFGFLFVAVNDGGHSVLTTQFAGGSLACPIARLCRQCQLIAHVDSPKKLPCRHASRDDHARQARAYMQVAHEKQAYSGIR
jgi:hypothetical protein